VKKKILVKVTLGEKRRTRRSSGSEAKTKTKRSNLTHQIVARHEASRVRV
jgi:hypothetical protein